MSTGLQPVIHATPVRREHSVQRPVRNNVRRIKYVMHTQLKHNPQRRRGTENANVAMVIPVTEPTANPYVVPITVVVTQTRPVM